MCGFLLSLSLCGCGLFSDVAAQEAEFKLSKLALERQIELLTLEKRKAIIEKQLDALHDSDLQLKVVPK